MTFKESIHINLTSKYFFVAPGRASRSEFWWFALFILLVNLACALILQLLPATWATSISLIVSLLLLPPNLAVTIRRLHDRNLRGWWLLVPILTLFCAIVTGGAATASMLASVLSLAMCLAYLAILCMPSQPGANRFGAQPPLTPIF